MTKSYAKLREDLDRTVEKLQDADCDVDKAAELYEQALDLIGQLEAHLDQAENRVRKLQADLDGERVAG